MDRVEKLIGEINGTMAIEGMPLTEEDRDMLRRCITGKTTPDEEIKRLVKKYSVVPER
ncbi:hypothetical protein CAFE_02900 [Caprobacter fermentans]|uniref:Antitoxin VbhA family protein n=1 Tax=Caproicibacter fermentans TaxID=2576756 RepID=A0A6N8HVP3_9FIRM|nr:hypothetical protein [Caproicibacter fermentans]MVB09630.1 hypothetical protein [Caproicibacter fermentans]QNK40106.1 antitoxin VbhA family protein [Caproicibacter fermentans]